MFQAGDEDKTLILVITGALVLYNPAELAAEQLKTGGEEGISLSQHRLINDPDHPVQPLFVLNPGDCIGTRALTEGIPRYVCMHILILYLL